MSCWELLFRSKYCSWSLSSPFFATNCCHGNKYLNSLWTQSEIFRTTHVTGKNVWSRLQVNCSWIALHCV